MSARRVLVLARAGAARDRTEAALVQAGAVLAAALDPAGADEAQVRAAAPDAVLVVLDPVAEAALEKFDAVLADPSLLVLFDDAEVAARRDGWEAARWARHLTAKLQGHRDVLPAPPSGAPARDFEQEMRDLTMEVAALQPLPPASVGSALALPDGAVVIAAGVGGPDAVRQLLAELPEDFPRPVLLRQRIEGGQYDRLVRQMQRAARMPVVLAGAGEPLRRGNVHVMPDNIDVGEAPAGLHFVEAAGSRASPRCGPATVPCSCSAARRRRWSTSPWRCAWQVAWRWARRPRTVSTPPPARRWRHAAARRTASPGCPVNCCNAGLPEVSMSDIAYDHPWRADPGRPMRACCCPTRPSPRCCRTPSRSRWTSAPDWLLGRIRWRGWQLPLVAFSRFAGIADEQGGLGSKVIVLKALGGDPKRPYFAVLTQGFPRLVTVPRKPWRRRRKATGFPPACWPACA